MSTKTTDTNNLSYNPGALGQYNQLQPQIGSTLSNFMQNPLTSSFFNQRIGMGQNQISKQAASGMQGLLSNFRASGMSGGTTSPFMQSMISRQGRATSGAMSSNFLGQLTNANQMQLGATGMAQGYQPLLQGSTSTQTTGGLGTWLPQLIGAAGSAALGAATGGASGGLSMPGGKFGSAVAPSNFTGLPGMVPGMLPSIGGLPPNLFSNPSMPMLGNQG